MCFSVMHVFRVCRWVSQWWCWGQQTGDWCTNCLSVRLIGSMWKWTTFCIFLIKIVWSFVWMYKCLLDRNIEWHSPQNYFPPHPLPTTKKESKETKAERESCRLVLFRCFLMKAYGPLVLCVILQTLQQYCTCMHMYIMHKSVAAVFWVDERWMFYVWFSFGLIRCISITYTV